MKKYLNSLSQSLKLAAQEADVSVPPITHIQEDAAFSQIEADGKTYHYPHLVHFNIECWNTFKFSLRVKDGKFIPEGTNLDGKGYTEKLLVKMSIDDKVAQKKFIESRNLRGGK